MPSPLPPPERGGTLTASGITVTRGAVTVLDRVDLVIAPGHRVGIVGPNGAGKSTLLRVLAGELRADSGRVRLAPKDLTVGYLPQETGTDAAPGETLRQAIRRRTGVAAAEAALDSTAAALAGSAPGADEAYADALERYLALGAPDLDARAEEVCDRLGLDPTRLDIAVDALSGGQRARGALAAVLLARFDVFLLDEPTNDLDFAGIAHLEAFVGELRAGAAIVSHDRRFLDAVVTEVAELDEHTHRTNMFGGGWSAYLEAREVARRHAEERYEGYVAERSGLLERAQTQKQWAQIGVAKQKRSPRDNDKAQRGFFTNKTEHLAAKVRMSEKRLERLENDAIEKPWERWDLRIDLGGGGRSGDVVARLEEAVVVRGPWRLGPIDVEIGWAERVAVVGPNGSGKSTLLGALLGSVPLQGGRQWRGPGVVVGELDQLRSMFEGATSVLESFAAATRMAPQEVRSLLAKFGLGAAHVHRRAGSLSPGERTRAMLALLNATEVNCLVLDEPTNHLDLPAIEELEAALDRYSGTLFLVTHDRTFLERVRVSRVLELDVDSTLTDRAQSRRALPGG